MAMKFIHAQGVLHRDLKPANILLDDRAFPLVADLTSCRFCDTALTLTQGIGTPLYMAPEMYAQGDYTTAIDVYSFALILYELLVRRPVFPTKIGPYALMRQVMGGVRPALPADMNPTVSRIIRRGWSVIPEKRPPFEQIFDLLRGMDFRIETQVVSARVSEFVRCVSENRMEDMSH
jgi:serine/threonine-protein kinase